MRNPVQFRLNNLIQQYLTRLTESNGIMSAKTIELLKKKGITHDPFSPISGGYRPDVLSDLDINAINAEIDTEIVDARTITDIIDELYTTIRERILLNQILVSMSKGRASSILKRSVYLTANRFIDGFTTEIDLQSAFKSGIENIDASGSGIRLKTENSEPCGKDEYTEDAVTVTVDPMNGTPNKSEYSPDIKGSKASIINRKYGNGMTVTLYSTMTEMVGITIRCNIQAKNVNSVSLHMSPYDHGRVVVFEAEDPAGKKHLLLTTLSSKSRVSADIDSPIDIRFLTIKIKQELPDSSIGGINAYSFGINKIKTTSTSRKNTAVIDSTAIKIDGDTKYISLVSDEQKPKGTDILYGVSQSLNDKGIPINYRPILPMSENTVDSEKFIEIGTRYITANISNTWSSISPETKFGGKLYPIANLGEIIENYDSLNIIEESIKLYRGVNDWAVDRKRIQSTETHTGIKYAPSKTTDGWYDDIPVLVSVKQEIKPISGITDNGKFNVKYRPDISQDYTFTDPEFTPINLKITDIYESNGNCEITVDRKLRPGDRYILRYKTSLENLTDYTTKIIRTETTLSTETRTLSPEIDYEIIDTDDTKRIRFIKSGSYKGGTLFAKFTVRTTKNNQSLIYKTTIKTTKTITVNIGPFNRSEIEAGNYHRIDDIDVSNQTFYELSAGVHRIESTQIHPEENQYTGNHSEAYVSVPHQEVMMTGFEESCRLVPVYDLILNGGTDHRQFTINNGIIYLNRIPEYPLSLAPGTCGRYLKTIRIPENSTDTVAVPEEFRIEIPYLDDASVENIYLKIEMKNNNPETDRTPEISKIGINQYKTIPRNIR